MTLEELVKELLKEGLTGIDFDYDEKNNSLCYSFEGFAKSGKGTLQTTLDGKIHLLTRYDQDDIIENIKDFLSVAYTWDSQYCRKDDDFYTTYGVSSNWKSIYEKYNFDISILR